MNWTRLATLPAMQLASFASESLRAVRGDSGYAEVPAVEPSLRSVSEAVLDRSFTLSMNLLAGVPRPETVRRQQREMAEAVALFQAYGWLDDPAAYHESPDPPTDGSITAETFGHRLARLPYGHLRFESGYEPHRGEPGRERWLEYDANRTAHVYVMEHPGGARPWLVCVHGFGMGTPNSNFPGFGAKWLHEELGLNLAFPCLPMHGPRGSGRISGGDLLAADYVNMLHSFAQAVWDIRRLLGWIRERGGETIGLYGVSLGGYNTALVAGFEADLACVIAGIPAADFPSVARDNEPWLLQAYEEELQFDWALLRGLTHVVSPLAFDPLPPRERRFIYAGVADRVTRPDQARALWRHWDRPEIHWAQSGHVAGAFKRSARDFVLGALRSTGMAE